jgi:hypothetical protein
MMIEVLRSETRRHPVFPAKTGIFATFERATGRALRLCLVTIEVARQSLAASDLLSRKTAKQGYNRCRCYQRRCTYGSETSSNYRGNLPLRTNGLGFIP